MGGETIPMVQDPINSNLWSCDYKLPQGFDEATYYFQTSYKVNNKNGASHSRELKSKLQIFRLENRYVGNLASYRGPVGVEIAVQGRGFTKYDSITMGEKETSTRYLSENELRFTVPAIPSGVDYPVQLIGGPHGALDIEISALMKVYFPFHHPLWKLNPAILATFSLKLITKPQLAI